MNSILTMLASAFGRGGFTVLDEESATRLHGMGSSLAAVPRLKKYEPSKCVSGRGLYLGTESKVTAAVKCYGKECGYSDGDALRTAAARAGRLLLLENGGSVRWISTGELVRDAAAGRLAVTVIIELAVYEETEVVSG